MQSLQAWALPWLQQRGVESPRLDGDLLLADALGVERLALFLDPKRPVAGEELARFKSHLQRRARREPVAYILGRRGFWKHEFVVTPAVLIPRPETELLLETLLAHFPPAQQDSPLTLLELGVGSGALLCAALLAYPEATGVGVDISAAALAVAEENGRKLGCRERMTLVQGDLLQPLQLASPNDRFHAILSNPPYVRTSEWEQLEPEIHRWEPRQALDGGADGLAALRRIPSEARPFLAEGGLLAVEIGVNQEEAVMALFEAAGLQGVELRLDYSRQPRVVSGRAGSG
ncbi:MAG: peptide chain release factor N(5)-glutamine methyltransferase [Magnetococcales bacterium]|nr:peptide chain release factor N(5)-glutamine methyltransferase [Magnetococcales bacterium]